MMKADVLSTFDPIKVCTHYKYQGELIDYLPYDIDASLVEPVYTEVPGWDDDLTGMTGSGELPENLIKYVEYLEKELNTPITVVSVGPDRVQTILRESVVV